MKNRYRLYFKRCGYLRIAKQFQVHVISQVHITTLDEAFGWRAGRRLKLSCPVAPSRPTTTPSLQICMPLEQISISCDSSGQLSYDRLLNFKSVVSPMNTNVGIDGERAFYRLLTSMTNKLWNCGLLIVVELELAYHKKCCTR